MTIADNILKFMGLEGSAPKSWDLRTLTLRYNGLFDFDGLYAAIVDWAKNYGYRWHEKSYKHKVPSSRGAEQELEWELSKDVNEFVNYFIRIKVHTWDQREIHVDVGGKTKSLTNARIEVILMPKVSFDINKKFKDGGEVGKLLGPIYMKIMKLEFETTYGDQLHYRTLNLQALMKRYFDMQAKYHAYERYLGEH